MNGAEIAADYREHGDFRQIFPECRTISRNMATGNGMKLNADDKPHRSPVTSSSQFFSTRPSRADNFTESVIREMTRLSINHGAINLAQGFPDFACPDELKVAASKAVNDDFNQYAIMWGGGHKLRFTFSKEG